MLPLFTGFCRGTMNLPDLPGFLVIIYIVPTINWIPVLTQGYLMGWDTVGFSAYFFFMASNHKRACARDMYIYLHASHIYIGTCSVCVCVCMLYTWVDQ